MRSMGNNCFLGQSGSFRNILYKTLCVLGIHCAAVQRHEQQLGITASQSQCVDFQIVKNRFCEAGLEVATHRQTHHGVHIHSAKTSL